MVIAARKEKPFCRSDSPFWRRDRFADKRLSEQLAGSLAPYFVNGPNKRKLSRPAFNLIHRHGKNETAEIKT
jgi:hypothetical protein